MMYYTDQICFQARPVKPVVCCQQAYCDNSSEELTPSLETLTPALMSALLCKKCSSYTASRSLRSARSSRSSRSTSSISPSTSLSVSPDDSFCDDFSCDVHSSNSTFSASLAASCLSAAERVPLCCHPLAEESPEEEIFAPAVTATATTPVATHATPRRKQSRIVRIHQLFHKFSRSSLLVPLLTLNENARLTAADHIAKPQEAPATPKSPTPAADDSWNVAAFEDGPSQFSDIQMKTYKTVYSSVPEVETMPFVDESEEIAGVKTREMRLNSGYLKFYALDNRCRLWETPKLSDKDIETYYYQFLDSGCATIEEFIENYVIDRKQAAQSADTMGFRSSLKLALLSRYKFWNGVFLPPRSDPPQVERRRYVYQADDTTGSTTGACLVRTRGKFVPWLNIDDFENTNKKCIPPYGRMANGTQFTVNGWCNERWASRC